MKYVMLAFTAVFLSLLYSCNNAGEKKTAGDTVGTTTTTANSPPTIDHTYVAGLEVPPSTRTGFEAKYPQATNVRWEYYRPDFNDIEWDWSGWPRMDKADYTARFTYGGSDYYALYDQDGNWIGTINTLNDENVLPEVVRTNLKNEFKNYTIVSIDKENDKDRNAYEIKIENGTNKVKVLMDEKGNILKRKLISGDVKTKEKINPKNSAM